ncbi:MAG: nicotinate-nucleotide adenylyltransferase [Ktedonobacterales bacterium]
MRTGPGYGILGGTFDPPHLGHLTLAQEVYTRLALDRVWFVPAARPPHKAGHAISPAADRRAMVELAIADDQRFGLSTVELERRGPSYTADTVRLLRAEWGPAARMVLILGWDMLVYLPQWHAPEAVLAGIDQLAAVHRPGVPQPSGEVTRLEALLPGLKEKLIVLPAPLLDVSSSELRARVAADLPVRYLTPEAVGEYIALRGLYRAPARQHMGGDVE